MADLHVWFHHFHLSTETYNFWTFVLLAVQAAFFVLQTCVFAATAYWAWRYTQETILLRREAQEQAKSAYKQFKLASEAFEKQKDDQIRAHRPYLDMRPITTLRTVRTQGETNAMVELKLKIAPIYAMQVITSDPHVNATSVPGFLNVHNGNKDDVHRINFYSRSASWPERWNFTVKYFTLLNQPDSQEFIMTLDAIESVEHNARVALSHVPQGSKALIGVGA